MTHKLGLKPHTPDERDIKLSAVYKATPSLPSTFGATGLDWGMLGNDTYGDCYWASAAHETMAQAHLAGRSPTFSDEHVLDSYAVYLGLYGHQALNERNDEGTDAREGAKYRRKSGVEDTNGHGHRIGAFTFIEEPDYNLIKSAVYDFEGVTVCVELPESAEERFESGVWDYVKGSSIAGGHAIAGTSVKNDKLYIVSWGEEVEMTEAFVEKYLQCVVVYVSGSVLNGEGKTVTGLDVAGLRSKLSALG
jgi:hypothetical protein